MARKPATKSTTRKPAGRKTARAKATAKTTTAKKTASRKAPTRKTAAKKAPARKSAADKFDHTFKAIYDHEVNWESDDVRGLLTLPEGVQVKVLNYDPVMKRLDMKQRFPKGYVEPRHTHKSWHSIMVLDGRMCVAGKDLRRGDYVFGWDIPHGPYEYPDGCEVFIVYMGDASHIWDEQEFLEHENIWKPETAAGRKGTDAHIRQRAKRKTKA